jgi:polyvinyl alcohol dehydrogenase (cytochrome)
MRFTSMLHIKNARQSAAPCGMLSRVVIAALGVFAAGNVAMAADWTNFGGGPANAASNASDVTPNVVSKLKPKWVYTTTGDVSARAAVANGVAYFPDWGGTLNAVKTTNGAQLWSHQFSDYFGDGVHRNSRTTPAVVNGVVYTATQEGAWLLAINANTGAILWRTQLESADPNAIITSSPTVVNGVVYTGTASVEEGLVAPPPFGIGLPCCIAHGSALAVSATTGKILWKTFMSPQGYTGTSVWGSSPVVDTTRNTVFVSTGNNYSHSTDPAYLACIAGGGTEANCISPNDYVDSIVALDLGTGAVKWAHRLLTWNQPYATWTDGSDSWNVSCFFLPYFPVPNCPTNPGPDYDFGSGPNLITYQTPAGKSKTIVGAGQKSGIYYAFDPDTGVLLWQTQVGPGSSLGGMEWGSASDGKRIYVAISNLNAIGYSNPALGAAGSWAALDPATGTILWQVADPNGSVDIGPMAVSNGIVYAGSMGGAAGAQTMFALDGATGNTLWSFAAGSSVNCGATIVGDTVFWGSGYAHLGIAGYTGNNKFYAFTKNGF